MKTTVISSTTSRVQPQGASIHPWFEWAVAFFATWFVIGSYLDGWAHTHRLPDSFFTPWHAVIYSGVLGAASCWGAQPSSPGATARRGARPCRRDTGFRCLELACS